MARMMPGGVAVKYLIFGADAPFTRVTRDIWTHIADLWAGCEGNGGLAAEKVAASHFEESGVWGDHFGIDCDCGEVIVAILAPAAAKGFYRVLLSRPVTGRAEICDGWRVAGLCAAGVARLLAGHCKASAALAGMVEAQPPGGTV